MANQDSQIRPLSPSQAPDPASVYERAKPGKEAGMGRMDNNASTPEKSADKMEHAVKNKQPLRQINSHDVVDENASQPADGESLSAAPVQPDHSMKEEEPMGWDQAPTDIKNPSDKRHPRTEGKGGTP